MAKVPEIDIHLVRVTTDDREHQLWAMAGARTKAVTPVLNAVAEGWTAILLPDRLKPEEVKILKLRPGEVRELTLHRPVPAPKTK